MARSDDERDAALDADTIDSPLRCFDRRFELRALIAKGGMGEVYEGFDRALSIAVAIKLLAPRFMSDNDVRARFQREAQALSALSHPNIVKVIAVGEGDPPYFVMERLAGSTLAEHIRRHAPLDHAQVLEIGRQLLAAIAHLHDGGLIHRDVKPANVMIAPDGHATLLDLGIARDEDSRLTNTGTTVGTPEFMAPEQARDARFASKASDLYAAGATLYAAWIGEPPFTGASAYEIVSAHHEREVPRPSVRRAELSSAVDAFVARALAKAPADRFSDAREMAGALAVLDGAPAVAHAARSRARLLWPLALAIAISAWALARTAREEPPSAQEREQPVEREPAIILSSNADASVSDAIDAIDATDAPDAAVVAVPKLKARPKADASVVEQNEKPSVRVVTLDRGLSTYAEITIDTEPSRFSPIADWPLAPGSHTIAIRRQGFGPKFFRFELAPGEHKKLEIALEPTPN